jgi:hypothetical protein
MRTKLSSDQSLCIKTQGKHTSTRQQQDEGMKTARRFPDIPYDPVFKNIFVNFIERRVQ